MAVGFYSRQIQATFDSLTGDRDELIKQVEKKNVWII